ncbi:alpha-ketoglutarate-dependent dioxygenase AlkB family protein [Mucilaginibacter sp. SP1R1]|uniref:alpha-ketoglutarate-dependent dioxygenase AlkB family protein n=1 Tax=Mucilaginibacter sp. SP1R1 TaxID=2723091 RepID=UPI001608408D|nr:alpha-ketoglutarate-dependent dioxygenase AlkB [Mucilaginibacter sp. SP1R1]MBB6151902.1 alkylated DNA repair dioxygenase AlkB [Mucilaginibacter sp. SP1R1]
MDLFSDNQLNIFDTHHNLLPFDGEVFLYPNFYQEDGVYDLFEELKHSILWKQDKMKIYGRQVNFPRLTSWYADNDKTYTYSGVVNTPIPFTPLLLKLKQAAETQCGKQFNSALLNFYRNGEDSMGWHSDDEKELSGNPVIASASFGATRTFQFKHKEQKNAKTSVALSNGSLLIMQGQTQHHWLHQVPKTTRQPGQRINITFRDIKY